MINLFRYGVDFKVTPQTNPELDYFWKNIYNTWESDTYESILPHLSLNKTFLDIGAWQGPISLIAQKYSKQCICFEPDPLAYEFLVKNIELNNFKNIIAINAAVSNEDVLHIGNNELGGGGSSYLRPQNSIKCNTISFPDILKQFNLNENNISVMKIDIEGYECELLQDPLIKEINVYKHISLHSGFFEDKEKYYNKLKIFFGKEFNFSNNEFESIFINKI
jgi:FkbM family methyltransferase